VGVPEEPSRTRETVSSTRCSCAANQNAHLSPQESANQNAQLSPVRNTTVVYYIRYIRLNENWTSFPFPHLSARPAAVLLVRTQPCASARPRHGSQLCVRNEISVDGASSLVVGYLFTYANQALCHK